jgi:polysaccharide deacetylase
MKLLAPTLLAVVGACHDHDRFQYDWDDRDVLCSINADDLTQKEPVTLLQQQLELARYSDSVALIHMHNPNVTISLDAIENLLTAIDELGLDYITWDDFVADPHVPGVALAFDDNFPDAWTSIRPMLDAHHAKVTFFVTRWAKMSDAEHGEIHQLATDGHSIEAHSVNHLNAPDYVSAHGLDAYLADEALPSIQVLEDAGFHITGYAFPFGASTDELDAALLQHVARVRVSAGSCPH